MATSSEVHQSLAANQQQFRLFLIAATGTSLGYCLQKLDGLMFSWWALAGIVAATCLLVSCAAGLLHVLATQAQSYKNLQHIQIHEQPAFFGDEVENLAKATLAGILFWQKRSDLYFLTQGWTLGIGISLLTFWRIAELFHSNAHL